MKDVIELLAIDILHLFSNQCNNHIQEIRTSALWKMADSNFIDCLVGFNFRFKWDYSSRTMNGKNNDTKDRSFDVKRTLPSMPLLIFCRPFCKCALDSSCKSLDHHYHRWFGWHSSWLAHCPPWSFWSWGSPRHFVSWICWILPTYYIGLLCPMTACHIQQWSWPCNTLHHTMTCHCGPFLDTLDMVKHKPLILKISSYLHALNEVHTTSRFVYQHLEDVDLIFALTWKDVAMDVFNCGVSFHSHDAIIGSSLALASK